MLGVLRIRESVVSVSESSGYGAKAAANNVESDMNDCFPRPDLTPQLTWPDAFIQVIAFSSSAEYTPTSTSVMAVDMIAASLQ